MTRRKIIKRTGRKTVRGRARTWVGTKTRRRGWTGRIFGFRRIHKHTGKKGWWLN